MKKVKVLTIQEPYVTPMPEGIKHFETRSWKTAYRGEIYIHTAKKIHKGMDRHVSFPLGCIVLKAVLTDCIYMDEEFIAEVKKDPQEYATGFYEVGRYAWKLENIEVIDPIKASGHLGIWEYDLEEGELK